MEKTSWTVALACRNSVGESPIWSAVYSAVFWTDIASGELWKFDPETGDSEMHTLDSAASSVVQCQDGRLLLACRDGLAFYDWELRRRELFREGDEIFDAGLIPNEGRCDPLGRYWFGTMARDVIEPTGSLYCLRGDLSLERVEEHISIPNSIAWSPDAAFMYLADSATNAIFVYDYDLQQGRISGRRPFARLSDDSQLPDGSAVDTAGNLWNASWGGGCVNCYSADGDLIETVDLPVSRPTSCAFGGRDHKTLFITTASVGQSEEQQRLEPLAGCLLTLPVSELGRIDYEFRHSS